MQSLCDRALASELVPFEARDEKLAARSRIHHAIQIPAVPQATKMTFQGQDLEGTHGGAADFQSKWPAIVHRKTRVLGCAVHETCRGRQQLGFYKMAAGGELKVHVEVSKDRLRVNADKLQAFGRNTAKHKTCLLFRRFFFTPRCE